jgi:membrane protein DedA with SNARE-associated domain
VNELSLPAVLLLMVPESACIPVPSEVTLMAAGFGVDRGLFSFPAAVLAATAGNLIGSLIAYAIGRHSGLERLPGRAGAIVARCDAIFDRYGDGAVFIARLLPLARTFVSLPAGHARIPLARFAVLTVAGCAVWSAAFVLAGDLAGTAWHEVAGVVGRLSLAVGAMVLFWVTLARPKWEWPRVKSGR